MCGESIEVRARIKFAFEAPQKIKGSMELPEMIADVP